MSQLKLAGAMPDFAYSLTSPLVRIFGRLINAVDSEGCGFAGSLIFPSATRKESTRERAGLAIGEREVR